MLIEKTENKLKKSQRMSHLKISLKFKPILLAMQNHLKVCLDKVHLIPVICEDKILGPGLGLRIYQIF